jgi:hypothetical protein
MEGDNRVQFNNYVSNDLKTKFQETLAKKYGIKKNMQSYEVDLLLQYYYRVEGQIGKALYDNTHTK